MPARVVRMATRRVGRRGVSLVIDGAVCCAYGTGIVLGYRPTFTEALGVSVLAFGWAWIACGVVIASGSLFKQDRLFFALSVLLHTMWATLIILNWQGDIGWAAAVAWIGMASLMLWISGWPDEADIDAAIEELGDVDLDAAGEPASEPAPSAEPAVGAPGHRP